MKSDGATIRKPRKFSVIEEWNHPFEIENKSFGVDLRVKRGSKAAYF